MAAFQIKITPPVKRVAKTEKLVEYVTPKLILAPFNPTPEIGFGSVTVNAKITKPLIIYNPNPQSITVQLRNIDPEDRISLSDSTVQLNSREEKEIYVSWSPLQSGYLRKVIRVQDACRKARSFDVILNGTCDSNKRRQTHPFSLSSVDELDGVDCNLTRSLSADSSSFGNKKTDLLFISPPTKVKSSKRSPEHVKVRRHVSSAISDRKRHLKSSILLRRKSPPSALRMSKVMPSVEKIRSHDPSSLKQVLRSHIDDPFLKQSLYCDENWIDRQEKDIIKWMNSLLTPPVGLNEETEWTVDAAAVWLKSCRDGNLRSVPSVDNIAAAVYYYSPQRLDTLRKVASSLLTSEPIRSVFVSIANDTQKKIISVREDRDLHLDQGLKNKLMQLLSCYNPLWLQIALEAIYDQKITRQGKVDVGGLGWFIRKYVLTSSISNKKNAHPAVLQMTKPNFKDQVKKYILQKFLCLIYFLDQAKMRKLVRHNPCLFVLTSEYKSSQDLLLAFCGDLVVGRGDITEHLKAINYVLQYKQTCIDEYDYNITSLHDLRDGVRLTRLFEILFNEADLCSKLRVPAISILQKIYNVSVAMKVAENKCTIEGDITAKEIVSGHREKILSFLWQIIKNYITPLYEKSATTIQRWWRRKVLPTLQLKKQQERKLHTSATVIQATWRGYVCRKNFVTVYALMREERTKLRRAAIVLQRKFRAMREMRKQRGIFTTTVLACIKLQAWWRCKLQRRKFLHTRSTIISMQRCYRARKQMIRHYQDFLRVKQSAVTMQRLFRANRMMRIQRQEFLNLKSSVIFCQRRFRANLEAKIERKRYLSVKSAAICIQNKLRAVQLMKRDRQLYFRLKAHVICIQRKFRALRAMKQQRLLYCELKMATICIQRRFRATKMAKKQREHYIKLKSATIYMQRKFRATSSMKRQRLRYLQLRNSAVMIQRKFRAIRLMKHHHLEYQELRKYSVLIQRRFRSNQIMKSDKCEYLKLKAAAINVQRLFRMKRQLELDRNRFLKIKQSVVIIQNKFRAYKLAKRERESYVKLKQTVISIQQRYRANRLMKHEQSRYTLLKTHVIRVQTLFRANHAMKIERKRYSEITNAALCIQKQFRANRLMKKEIQRYTKIKAVVVFIQRKFRANLRMRTDRNRFLELKMTCIFIQRIFRANIAMKRHRDAYVELKNGANLIQQRFRANRAMKLDRYRYQSLRKAVITIQRKYRAVLLTRQERGNFLRLKQAALFVQRTYKRKSLAQKTREEFLCLKSAVVTVQQIFRINRNSRIQRREFLKTKLAAVTVQRRYRSIKNMRIIRTEFLRLKNAAVVIQNWYRAIHAQRVQMQIENAKVNAVERSAAVKIQALWRGYQSRKKNVRQRKSVTLVKKQNPNLDTKITLEERYKKAILQLKTSDMYDVITHALWNLESVTMLSAKLCEGVAAEHIIPIIFDLMARGNRSEPSLEIYRASCSILINLARHKPTKIVLWETINKVDDIFLILHVMKITHDKPQVPVFRYASTLLWLLCQDVSAAQAVAGLYSLQQQIEQMLEKLKRVHLKIPHPKKAVIPLPKTEADWFPEPQRRVFENDYVAIINVRRILFNR